MEYERHYYNVSFWDIILLWFTKKRCKKCDSKLKSFTEKKFIQEGPTQSISFSGISYGYEKQYAAKFKYRCVTCGEVYEVNQLLGK